MEGPMVNLKLLLELNNQTDVDILVPFLKLKILEFMDIFAKARESVKEIIDSGPMFIRFYRRFERISSI